MRMSPRTGRPIKGEEPKNISLQLRISKKTADELKECAEILKVSRTEVIEKAVENIFKKLKK
jgi:hypothetical protein